MLYVLQSLAGIVHPKAPVPTENSVLLCLPVLQIESRCKMKKIRVIVERHRKSHHPHVIFLEEEDFDTPVDTFLLLGCELMLDTVIEVKNWPDDFPMGFRLMHDPHLIVQSANGYEWVKELEEQWQVEPELDKLPKGVYKVDHLPRGLYEMNICDEIIRRGDRLWKIIGLTEEGMAVVKDVTNEKK